MADENVTALALQIQSSLSAESNDPERWREIYQESITMCDQYASQFAVALHEAGVRIEETSEPGGPFDIILRRGDLLSQVRAKTYGYALFMAAHMVPEFAQLWREFRQVQKN